MVTNTTVEVGTITSALNLMALTVNPIGSWTELIFVLLSTDQVYSGPERVGMANFIVR